MPLNSREEKFIAFVNTTIKSGKAYLEAIRKLEKKINKKIFDTSTLGQLETMYERLLMNGDLHDFNVKTSNRTPSAAIRKLIAFHRAETSKT